MTSYFVACVFSIELFTLKNKTKWSRWFVSGNRECLFFFLKNDCLLLSFGGWYLQSFQLVDMAFFEKGMIEELTIMQNHRNLLSSILHFHGCS